MTSGWDVLTVGRVSVDLYAREPGAGFDSDQSFVKSVGGSPTNVAVAAARLGLHAGVVTKVGDDGFGAFVRRRLQVQGVDTSWVGTVPGASTPLALAALDPPEDPSVVFYRGPAAPDTTITVEDVPESTILGARAFWMSQGALAQGSTAKTSMTWLEKRARAGHTLLDLDYRPALWSNVAQAREAARAALEHCTAAVGNRGECQMAVGESDPDAAADALLNLGLSLAVVKMGSQGVLLATTGERVRVPSAVVPVVCGLGAGDAFGGALVLGLLEGWSLAHIGAFAHAAGALVVQQLTCSDAMPAREAVEAAMSATEGAP